MDNSHHSNQPNVVYILDRFPVLSETFVLQEILELKRKGLSVRPFSLFEPSDRERARGAWEEHMSITYLSRQSKLVLLMMAIRRFFKTPRRLLRVILLTFAHHSWRTALSYFCYGVFVTERIERQDIKHLHAHFASGGTSVAQIVSLLTGIPYSFTTHAYDIYLADKASLAYKMKYAHFSVTCSIYNVHYLEKLVDEHVGKRIHCIYVGLNLDLFPTKTPAVQPTGAKPLIVAVCRLIEKKGLLYLVAACRILKDQGYDFLCRIVGDGPQRPLLEQKIRELALTDTVELAGSATHEQVLALYQQTTIVALPCIIAHDGDRDGIPNVLMEALYMKIPAVSTPVSGIPELILSEQNGLLVPPEDSAALATAIARLLDDPELCDRLTREGRETICKRFDVAKNTQTLIELFFAQSESTISDRVERHSQYAR